MTADTATPRRGSAATAVAGLCAVVVATRVALHAAGLPFAFSLDWMWLADPGDLRDRLAQTLYWYHAFPPGMNLLTGVLLKAGGTHAATLGLAAFWALGLVLAGAMFHAGRASGLSARVSAGLTLAFMISPPAIYFEHLYLYEWPVTALLCLAAALFHEAVRRQSGRWWLAFFGACAAIAVVRSTFHLVWLLGMIGLAASFARRGAVRPVLLAAAGPLAALGALYVKNYVLVGAMAASTFGPAAFALATVGHVPPATRQAWIRQGRLSPVAAVSVYAPPREYLRFFASSERPAWPPQVTRLEQASVAAANFNHWLLLDVHRWRTADAAFALRARPGDYVRGTLQNLVEMFGPSTEWHPHDRAGGSPHTGHRRLLRAYEQLYNGVVHAGPLAPVGLYALLPLALLWTGSQAYGTLRRRRQGADADATAALQCFCLLQIAYVVAASSMLTAGEMSRYRFQVEPLIWIVAAGTVAGLMRRARGSISDRPACPGSPR